jgi:hypothetical protein
VSPDFFRSAVVIGEFASKSLTRIFQSAANAASNLSVGRRCRAAQISGRSGSFAQPSYEICGPMIQAPNNPEKVSLLWADGNGKFPALDMVNARPGQFAGGSSPDEQN